MSYKELNIKSKVFLAPMAGVADRAFRELCAGYGAGYITGEMASAKGISIMDKKSSELLFLSEKERPGAIQLFGSEPSVMAKAAEIAMEYKPDSIDINMGCPAPKIALNGGGSALHKNPRLAGEIIAALRAVTDVPLTAKIRSGWDKNSINAVEMAKICEAAGTDAICVHGRTREQMYSPPVDFDVIKAVKKAVKIPVIGNGDITDGKAAAKMLERTGCDFVMVGRGAMGRPYIFSIINAYLKDGTILPEPPVAERMRIMLAHVEQICKYKGDYIGMREARKHAAWYIKSIKGAASFRREIGCLESMEQLSELAWRVVKSAEEN